MASGCWVDQYTKTKKRIEAQKRGAESRRKERVEKTRKIFQKAHADIERVTQRDLWIMGVMLYWAEGSKQKEHNPSADVDFANSDPRVINFFLLWLDRSVGIEKSDISLSLYIHENSRNRVDKVIQYWSKRTGFSKECFSYVYFKKHNPKTKRKKTGEEYVGLVSVRVWISTEKLLDGLKEL